MRRSHCWTFTLALLAALPTCSLAGPVLPGWDLLATTPGTSFAGVPFEGVPLGSFDFGGTIGTRGTGNADTIVQRLGPALLPLSVIPIELVALQLKSIVPVDMGAGLGFYFITLQKTRGGPASVGQQTIRFDTPNSGTFDSFFDVFFDLRFDDLTGPIVLSDQLRLQSSNTPWTTTPPPGAVQIDGVNRLLNGTNTDGDFWPGPISEQHPSGAQHNVTTATPEPASISLLCVGVASVAGYRWRRRKTSATL